MYELLCNGCDKKVKLEQVYAIFVKDGKTQYLCRDCCKRKAVMLQHFKLHDHNGHYKKHKEK